jgi:hypothetical protein
MLTVLEGLTRYIGLTRNSTYPVYCFVATEIRPSDVVQIFGFDDDYSFAMLQASPHLYWLNLKGSNRGTGPRYTPESVFDTFPWPQSPTKKQIDAVAAAGREVRRVRGEALKVISGGLRAVYRTLELPGKHPLKDAHAALDAAVMAAYGFNAKKDLLAQLLALNADVAAREKAGKPVTPPGVPALYGDPSLLITDDCIRPV